MSLDPAILERTLAGPAAGGEGHGPLRLLLRPAHPVPGAGAVRKAAGEAPLSAGGGGGVERVYTACPNCGVQLRELGGVQVISLWPVLEQRLRPEDLAPAPGKILRGPRPLPHPPGESGPGGGPGPAGPGGAAVAEPAHCRERTICCGNYHMAHTLAPEKSAAMRRRRTAEFPAGLPVVSCCEGCLGAFRGRGFQPSICWRCSLAPAATVAGATDCFHAEPEKGGVAMTDRVPLILDCDNTMGVPGRDVDDGLALLYLLGSPQVELLAVTCSFGNSTQEVVYRNTLDLLARWGRETSRCSGGRRPCPPGLPAAEFLAETARKRAGALRLLVTGFRHQPAGGMGSGPRLL